MAVQCNYSHTPKPDEGFRIQPKEAADSLKHAALRARY